MRSITEIVEQFKALDSERDRYVLLSSLMDGPAGDLAEMRFRATLCTALREEGIYPKEGL